VKFRWETEFKETEIGEIPREWEVSKIGIFYKLKYGITATSSEFGNCRLLRQTDLKEGMIDISSVPYSEVSEDKIQKYLLKEDDLVISRIANVGSIGYVNFETLNSFDKPLIFGSYLLKFEKIKEIHNKFTFYFLLSPQIQDYIKSTADGSTRQNTNAKVVAEFPLYVPSLPEQSRIATVLSWFDDLIEVKKRQNEILEKTAMAIFKSWFIDFEPFRDGEFVYSEELGKEIPKGWEVRRLGELAEFTNGLSYTGREKYEEPIDDGMVFITLNNILRGGGFKTEYSWIKSERIKEHQTLNEGDLIIANTDITQEAKVIGSPAIVVFPSGYKGKGVYSHHVTKITFKLERLKFFLYSYLKITQDENATFSTGTNVLGLDIDNFKRNKIVILPPSHILQSFHSLVEPLFQKIILNQKQIMTLRKIRDTLLLACIW